MSTHYLYLLIDIGCLIIPLIFSFHPRINFHREWKWFLPANAIIALLYLLWDIWFTKIGIWGFSEKYTTGIKLSNLPIEEVLFFICIPYACVFTYYVFKKFKLYTVLVDRYVLIQSLVLVVLMIYLVSGWGKLYTTTAVVSAYIILRIMGHQREEVVKPFFMMYFVILPAFIISNGLLTGYGLEEPVVWYNNAENLGIRFITIPIEDFLYGYSLLGANVLLYETFKRKIG